MIHLTFLFLCNTFVFMFLLEDRFQFFTTVMTSALTYGISLLAAKAVSFGLIAGPEHDFVCLLINCGLLFLTSLFLYQNRALQKLYVTVLCASSYYYVLYLSDAFLSILPIDTAGSPALVLSTLLYLLFYLLVGLCLYRPLHYFSERESMGFVAAITLVQLMPTLLVMGLFDRFFPTHDLTIKLIACTAVYFVVIFTHRSLYSAAKFRGETVQVAMQKQLIQYQTDRFAETYSLMQEHQRLCRDQDYVLDAVTLMVRDQVTEQIPDFIRAAKTTRGQSVFLRQFHANQRLNAVLVTHAAYARDHGIDFECNVSLGEKRVGIDDLCTLTHELLSKACVEASGCYPESRVRFCVSPTEETLRIEVVFSAHIESYTQHSSLRARIQSIKSISFSNLFQDLFREVKRSPNDLSGLDQTREIIRRYSGSLNLSNTQDSMMLHIAINA